jgi:hypothetical protein
MYDTYVKVRLHLCDRLVYHTTTESHAMSAEPSESEIKKGQQNENREFIPCRPMKMCAVPNKSHAR